MSTPGQATIESASHVRNPTQPLRPGAEKVAAMERGGPALNIPAFVFPQSPDVCILRAVLMLNMAHKYSELPSEDKLESEHSEVLAKRSTWTRISLFVLSPLILVTSILVVVGIANVLSGRPALSQLTWFAHTPRAPDGQFLLGVGKADITGYVKRHSTACYRTYC
jgi:hypothetical protein